MKRSHTQILGASVIALGLVLVLALRVDGLGKGGCARSAPAVAGPDTRAAEHLTAVGDAEAIRAAQAPDAAHGFFAAPVGREFVYEITGKSSARIELEVDGQLADEAVEHRVAGRMQVAIAAHQNDELVALVSFPQTSVEAVTGGSMQRDAPLEEAIAVPCLVRFQEDGRLLGFRFDPKVAPAARNWMRSEISAFHFEVEGGSAAFWDREEQDPTGSSRVRYLREAEDAGVLRLRKTRLSRDVVVGPENGAKLDVETDVTSDTSGVLSKTLACVESAAFDERLVIPVKKLGLTTRVTQSGSLRLVAHGWCAPGTLPEIDWTADWDSVSGSEDVLAMGENGDKMLRARLLEGVTLQGLLAEIDMLARAEPRDIAALMDARHKLAELLIDQPALIAELAPLIPTMNAATADFVLGAVGAAGTEQAQTLLAGVLTDTRLPNSLRQSSLDALFQLTKPTTESFDAVSSVIADKSVQPGLRANGMLVLGALSSMDPASQSDASKRIADLVQLESQARNDHKLEHWLLALGNTGSPEVFSVARPYLDNSDPTLRSAAAEAARGATSTDAVEALSKHALSDADSRVRKTCVSILADRSDAKSLATVRKVLENETAINVRRAAVDALARHAANGAVRGLLVFVAGNDPSAELRERASAAL